MHRLYCSEYVQLSPDLDKLLNAIHKLVRATRYNIKSITYKMYSIITIYDCMYIILYYFHFFLLALVATATARFALTFTVYIARVQPPIRSYATVARPRPADQSDGFFFYTRSLARPHTRCPRMLIYKI